MSDDLEYCYQVLDYLYQIEVNRQKRKRLTQEVEKAGQRKKYTIILLTILVVMFIIFILLNFKLFPTVEMKGLIFIGIVGFFGLSYIGNKKFYDRRVKMLGREISLTDENSRMIVYSPLLTSTKLSEEYLSIDKLLQLISYMKKNQANSLDEAIYMIESDIKNVKHIKESIKTPNIFQEEKDYLNTEYPKSISSD